RGRRDRFEWFEGDVDVADGSAGDTDADRADGEPDRAEPDVGGTGDGDESTSETPDETESTSEVHDETEPTPEIPDDGVIRPDFSVSERDYSRPAERIDTGEYAVDRFPSDADVPHRTDDRDVAADEPVEKEEDADDGPVENDAAADEPVERKEDADHSVEDQKDADSLDEPNDDETGR
ncbi:MAG: PH domain-containing protein, partial [Halobacteriota archaeon]